MRLHATPPSHSLQPKKGARHVCLIKYLEKHQDIVYFVNDQQSRAQMYKYLLCKTQKNYFLAVGSVHKDR